jgi:nitronate monooxygenase
MNHPQIIQGGMGVAISDWKLANAVARLGQLGVVSGIGIAVVMTGRLMHGDPGGHIRRALSHFPFQEPVQRILDKFYVEGGIPKGTPMKRLTMWTVNPPKELNEITVIANFVEVWLAKEGHNNPVGLNLLEKVQLPNLSSLYGAMLAGVDYVLMGAGIPIQVPGVLDALVDHHPVSYRLDVVGADKDDDYQIHFDPEATFPGISERMGSLKRPIFLPIISSVVLAKALLTRSTGEIQGFIIEGPLAGGHNAPPRGALKLNEYGEPIYGEKDVVDLEKIKELGLPFWLAGSYGNPAKFREALAIGATGVQIGTAFAFCDDSGMDPNIRQAVLARALEDDITVRTSALASPTGFPFKVVMMPGTIAYMAVYEARERLCDLGYLRTVYKNGSENLGYRCPAEPVDQFVKKGGTVEEAEGRTCLCNHLAATAGYANTRRDGYTEPPIITSGDDLVNIKQFVKDGQTSYTAKDVIEYILGEPVNT